MNDVIAWIQIIAFVSAFLCIVGAGVILCVMEIVKSR